MQEREHGPEVAPDTRKGKLDFGVRVSVWGTEGVLIRPTEYHLPSDGIGKEERVPRGILLIQRGSSEIRDEVNEHTPFIDETEGIVSRIVHLAKRNNLDAWEAVAIQRENGDFVVVDSNYELPDDKFDDGSNSTGARADSHYFMDGDVLTEDSIESVE
ncbi:MAG: hypothetical protein ABIA83_03410 [Patescibacteria group bacterium]